MEYLALQPFLISTKKRRLLKRPDIISKKIFTAHSLAQTIAQWRLLGKTIAFTNGVFDILHPGHIFSLSQAAREADYLVVGINSDDSVKRLKGDARPIHKQDARALVIAALHMVDGVIIFEEDTPLQLILMIRPDVLVKGGDYPLEQVVGAKEVSANGGRVIINPILDEYSTTGLIGKIKKS